ncbi:MAG: hypothetical protein HYU66_16120 [Armatimonadetes bacterium]|nr:hypothetical protein [Armatimonadota bacterium]
MLQSKRPARIGILVSGAIAFAVGLVGPRYALSTGEPIPVVHQLRSLAAGAPIALVVLALIGASLLRCGGPDSRDGLGIDVAVCAFPLLLLLPYFAQNAWPRRMSAMAGVALRAEPVIGAIERFRKREHRPPGSLRQLVPNYLDKLPTSGLRSYPDFRPELAAEPSPGAPAAAWELVLPGPRGWFGEDVFCYRPDQNYPDYAHGGTVTRVDGWGYARRRAYL